MIDEVNIHNFRCFKSLEVSGLKPVNLLVGPNSSGKSAFLESLFISSGPFAANVSLQLRALRRMGNQLQAPTDPQTYRGVWEDLFFDFNPDKKISIKIVGEPISDSRSLFIEYTTPSAQELPFNKSSSSGAYVDQITVMPQIEFKWKRHGFKEVLTQPKFTTTGLKVDITAETFFPALWFSPGAPEAPEDTAKRFSDLDKRGDMEPVQAAIVKEFPFIRSLSIQYHAGIPMVFADVENLPRKMPTALLSDGINRLVAICVGLGYYKGGTILIDQLEDGFHHKILPSLWSSIYGLAKELGVQLFISTHSQECMKAMLPTLRGHDEDFCLLRAAKAQDTCVIDSLTGNYLESALEQEFEVR